MMDVSWRELRALRADPPVLALKGERRRVFTASLEQAEQLFEGASSLGYASRPLNLFYGLSQAGRALAAAQDSCQSTWRLKGHGITHKDATDTFENRTLIDQGDGAFGAVAQLLGSPSFDTPVQLGRILAAIPGSHNEHRAPWLDHPRALRLIVPRAYPGTLSAVNASLTGLPDSWVMTRFESDDDHKRAILDELTAYPALSQAQLPAQGPVPYEWTSDGWALRLTLRLPRQMEGEEITQFVAEHGGWYRGACYVLPAFPGYEVAHHPLVLWWAALWTLSMLARYEPATWVDLINVDTSRSAVPLEALLDDALEALPQALVDTLRGMRGMSVV